MSERVSVIIPAYNEERYIGKCLDSLLRQTYVDMEIIAIDDGSKDKTLEILRDYEKKYKNIKILTQNRQGPGRARNFGAKEAMGGILVLVDADMEFDKDYIKYLVQPIIDGKCTGTSHMQEYIANKDNIWARCWGMKRVNPKTNWKNVGLLRAILKKEFLKKGGFDPKSGYFDDGSLYEKNEKVGLAVKDAICYHNNPSSLKEVFNHSKWIGGSIMIDYKNLLNLKFILNSPKRARQAKFIFSLLALLGLFTIIILWIFKVNLDINFLIFLMPGLLLIPLITLTINRTICEKYPKYILFLPVFYLVKFSGLSLGALEQIPNIINKKIRGKEIVYKYYIKS